MPSAGVYIQVPFCQTKCTYCNFHTGVVSSGRFAPYIDAVCSEIARCSRLLPAAGVSFPRADLLVDTVYIGGGTPSLLDPALLARILGSVNESLPCTWTEVSLEADPETVTAEKAQQWLALGINRISFGAQSFIDEELKAAGRMHRREDIYKAVPVLREAGFRNFSFDLIAGLPKQTHPSWRQSLSEAVALSPEHISIYIMEIDEGSRLGREVLNGGARYSARELPSEEAMAEFYELAQQELRAPGYEQYEISNWAKRGFASRHNLKYWGREPYLGFGAGAHSFSGAQRWANLHDAAAYVAAISEGRAAIESVEAVSREAALEEEIFLGLRQLSGIDLARITREYEADFESRVAQLTDRGLLERDGEIVRLNPAHLSISNEVLVELLR